MKKKVLLVWWYDRKDLITPYLEMLNEIEFTVLFYRFHHQENKEVAENLPFKRIYWLDYISPYQLLKDIQPDKILFFGNESVLTISLIAAANVKGITTCYVSHGLKSDLKFYLKKTKEEKTFTKKYSNERYSNNNINYTQKKWHTLLFLLLTFSVKNLSTISLIFQTLKAEFKGGISFQKLKRITNSLRQTRFYYLFAPENALMHVELDRANENRFLYTGPYSMDTIFKELKEFKTENTHDFWLLIDQPTSIISWEDRLRIYNSIASHAENNRKRLIIKLHPMQYFRDLKDSDKIKWLKTNDNIAKLIQEASGIIGFHSTMLLPIICYKKCILIDIHNKNLVKKWESYRVIKRIDYHNFNVDDINFGNFDVTHEDRQNFINQFVVYTDGKSQDRLKKLILS